MPTSPDQIADLSGQVVDRYRIDGPLGVGGFGAVYRATHIVTGRTVALKLLHRNRAFGPDIRERFLLEARAAAAVGSPHIVEIYDAGTTGTGDSFLAMELLSGETLGDRIARVGAFQMGDAIDVALQMLEGLGAAHERGVVHRDLKPANIFLADARGKTMVKVLDFGVSKFMPGADGARLTKTGMLLGTPYYMAPEQFISTRDVDGRADLYAVSAILYEMLCGEKPYVAESFETLIVRIQAEPPTPLSVRAPWLPAGLRHVVERGLAKDPDGRWQTATELVNALRTLSLAGTKDLGQLVPGRTLDEHAAPTPIGNAFEPKTPLGDPFARANAAKRTTPAIPSARPPAPAFQAAATPSASGHVPTASTPSPSPSPSNAPVLVVSSVRPIAPAAQKTGSRWWLVVAALLAFGLTAGGVVLVLKLLDGDGSSGAVAAVTPVAMGPVAMNGAPTAPTIGAAPSVPAPSVPVAAPTAPADGIPPTAPVPDEAQVMQPTTSPTTAAAAGGVDVTSRPLGAGVPRPIADAIAARARGSLAACRQAGSRRRETIMLQVGAGGTVMQARPDPPWAPADNPVSQCCADVFRRVGAIDSGEYGIVFFDVTLAPL